MRRFRKKGRLFKAELTIWINEESCLMADGTTDGMAVYETLVVNTDYDGWVLDWEEEELHIVPQEEGPEA